MIFWNNKLIYLIKICKTMSFFVFFWNIVPQLTACFFTSISNSPCDNLTGLSTENNPDPYFVSLMVYKWPQFIYFHYCWFWVICIGLYECCAQRRQLCCFFFSQMETVFRATPKVLVNPRKLLRSWYALIIFSLFSSVYPFDDGFSRLCLLQDLQ